MRMRRNDGGDKRQLKRLGVFRTQAKLKEATS